MNEIRKSEGQLIETVFADDDRSRAHKLLDMCKQRDKQRNLTVHRISRNTWIMISPEKIKNYEINKSVL